MIDARRLRFAAALLLVAGGGAAFAIAFRLSLAWVYGSLYGADNVVEGLARLAPVARFCVVVAGAASAGLIVRLTAARSQGVSNVMEAVVLGRVTLSLRTTAARASASWAAIAGGMSIGREGPLIEFAGSLAAVLGRGLRVSQEQLRILVAAGTAGGFAAAYNTPFAAVVFVLETIVGVAAPALILPVMAVAAIAAVLTRAAVGAGPIYGERLFTFTSYGALASFVALGALAAVAAVLFKQVLRLFEDRAERWALPQPWQAIVGGLVVAAIASAMPTVAGNGFEPLNAMLDAPPAPAFVVALLLAKVVATGASVGAGVPGGIFTPMLLVGAALGSLWGQGMAAWTSSHASPGSFVLVGMAATTAASIHAPLTASILVFELSGDYLIVLPLLLATVVATSISRAMGSASVYETELHKRGLGWELTVEGRRFRNAPPSPLAPADGARDDATGDPDDRTANDGTAPATDELGTPPAGTRDRP